MVLSQGHDAFLEMHCWFVPSFRSKKKKNRFDFRRSFSSLLSCIFNSFQIIIARSCLSLSINMARHWQSTGKQSGEKGSRHLTITTNVYLYCTHFLWILAVEAKPYGFCGRYTEIGRFFESNFKANVLTLCTALLRIAFCRHMYMSVCAHSCSTVCVTFAFV